MSERTRSGVEPSGIGQLRAVIGAFYVGLIAVVVAAVFAGRAANGLAVAAMVSPTPQTGAIPYPLSYHDPHKLFTVTIPYTWHVVGAMTTITVRNHAGKTVIPIYLLAIKPFSNETAHRGDELFIKEYILPNASVRQWQCSQHAATNTTIDGLPATQLAGQSVWLLDTATAHYQIDVAYPGAVIAHADAPGIRFTPSDAQNANQTLMQAIFATFKPVTEMPLACGA